MMRVSDITDPELKRKVCEVLAEWRGFTVSGVPEWYELDDADYVEVLNEVRRREMGLREDEEPPDDPRE
ncbi:MAG: hypothetical protein ACK4PI_03600 [Tepidisphaerales bacterium]